jgi:hypothetical protein
VDGHHYSLAEAFAAVVWAVLHPEADRVPFRRVIGPVDVPSASPDWDAFTVQADDVAAVCQQAERSLSAYRRVPADVEVRGRMVPPATVLVLAAKSLLGETGLRVEPAPLYPEGFDDVLTRWDALGHELIGFFPDRGRNTRRMKQALKLQYWSYRPARFA